MLDRLIEKFRLFKKAIIQFMKKFYYVAAEFLLPVFREYRRIRHLALHAKKARVRKKNATRLFEMLSYELKRRGALWQK